MAQEIELKLAVPDDAIAALTAWLDAHARAHGERELRNVYLDTPEHDLARARAALRLRRQGAQWLQTLKTAGRSECGLAARHEWEVPVAGEVLEPDAFPEEARAVVAPLAARLAPVFRTDFRRRTWTIEQDGAQVEAALDLGTITAPGSEARHVIQELELEWLSGEAALAGPTLLALARRLRSIAPLTPSDLSKAARGYQLAGAGQRADGAA